MDKAHKIFWLAVVVCSLAGYICLQETLLKIEPRVETFNSMVALDSSPSTSEVKGYYKTLLLYADADFKGSGAKSMRILADLSNRLFDRKRFRNSLRATQILANYPKWLVPLDTTTKEAEPSTEEAVQAELRILSYLQANFPQEPDIVQQTGSIVTHIINDFGQRFIFEKGENIVLKHDFLFVPLTRNWTNPTAGL
jgi:hypothetical protein